MIIFCNWFGKRWMHVACFIIFSTLHVILEFKSLDFVISDSKKAGIWNTVSKTVLYKSEIIYDFEVNSSFITFWLRLTLFYNASILVLQVLKACEQSLNSFFL